METKIIKGCHALIRLPRNSVDKERNFLIPEIRKDSPNFPISRSGHKFGENRTVCTLISLINVEVGINVEGVQKLPNH